MSICIEVWGDYASFNRPEMKVERVSYDVITPSAARGLIESIYFHPGLRWVIDRIYVLNPIVFTNIRRNEMKSKITGSRVRTAMKPGEQKLLYLSSAENRLQRMALVLKNVHYVIEAHFEMTGKANPSDNPGKFQDITKRRLRKGQCYSMPYFGCREFPANFRLYEGDEVLTAYPNENRDLGFMLYDLDYSDPNNIKPMFFRAQMENGVIDLTGTEVFQ